MLIPPDGTTPSRTLKSMIDISANQNIGIDTIAKDDIVKNETTINTLIAEILITSQISWRRLGIYYICD